MKALLTAIGCLAVALAILGIFLPVLPTTPFLLLASACFLRSSQRMHRWLLANRLFGEYIRDFENGNGIPQRAKVTAIALLWGSLLLSIYKFEALLVRAALIAIGAAVSVWIIRIKRREQPTPDRR